MKEKLGILAAISVKKRFIACVILDIIYLVITFFTITIATFGVGACLVILTMTSFFELVAEDPSYKLYDRLNKFALVLGALGIILQVIRG